MKFLDRFATYSIKSLCKRFALGDSQDRDVTFNSSILIEDVFANQWSDENPFVIGKDNRRSYIGDVLVFHDDYADLLDFTTK